MTCTYAFRGRIPGRRRPPCAPNSGAVKVSDGAVTPRTGRMRAVTPTVPPVARAAFSPADPRPGLARPVSTGRAQRPVPRGTRCSCSRARGTAYGWPCPAPRSGLARRAGCLEDDGGDLCGMRDQRDVR